MSSNLKVNSIVPATGNNVAIGTAGGTISYNASVSGVSTFIDGISVGTGGTVIKTSSNGNIGVGVDPSATIKLYVRKNDATTYSSSSFNGHTSVFIDNATNGGYTNLILGCASTTTGSSAYAGIAVVSEDANDTNGALAIGTRGSGAPNITEKVRVDSSGRVTMPYQPSFMVYVEGAQTYGAGWQKIIFSSSWNGAAYNKSDFDFVNNRYNVPVAGKYLFSAAVTFTGSTNTDGTITLSKNGTTDGGRSSAWASGTGLGGVAASYVLDMSSSDYCEVRVYFSGSNTTRNTQFAGYFSGFLVG